MKRETPFGKLMQEAGVTRLADDVSSSPASENAHALSQGEDHSREPSSQPADSSGGEGPTAQPYRYLVVLPDGSLGLRENEDLPVERLLAAIETWPIGFGGFPGWRTLTPYVWRSVDARRGRREPSFDACELIEERAAAFARARRSGR